MILAYSTGKFIKSNTLCRKSIFTVEASCTTLRNIHVGETRMIDKTAVEEIVGFVHEIFERKNPLWELEL